MNVSPTKTPVLGPLTLTFSQNFEGGNMNGFRYVGGDWSVVPENNTNKVLQAKDTGTINDSMPYIEFGPKNFHSGVIQYRFNILTADNSNANSGSEFIFFE